MTVRSSFQGDAKMKAKQIIAQVSRIRNLLLSVLLIVAFLAAALPQPAKAAATCVYYYTVKKGDTRSKIAHRYSLRWREIATANNLEEPYNLEVGQKLCIPAQGSSSSSSTVTMSVSNFGNLVKVTLSNPSHRTVYNIKMRSTNVSIGGWYKLGRIRVLKNATGTALFSVPKDLKGAIWISVCAKNATTDELLCKTIVHP
jgi:LysM repeat protein